MRYERVKIVKDERTVYNRGVLPWEIAILELTFGDGSVETMNAFEDNDLPYPEPREEFNRLSQVYGSDPESGVPFVAGVYGQASSGVRALARVIAESKAEARKALPKRPRAARIKEFSGDPLMG